MSEVPPKTNNNTPPAGWDSMGKKQGMSWDDLSEDDKAYQRWLSDNDSRATSKGTYLYRDVRENPRQEGESTEEYATRLKEVRAARGDEDEFAGERNINSKTGKERKINPKTGLYYEFDSHPRQEGETREEYGVRLTGMHEMTRQYEAKQAAAEENEVNKAEEAEVDEAKETETDAEKLNRSLGEKERSYEMFIEEALKDKMESEEKIIGSSLEDKMESEEKIIGSSLEVIESSLEDKLKENELLLEELGPLVAVNADFTLDRKDLAHDLAEQELNADVAKKGIITRIWKGNLFKKFFQKQYERQFLSGERKAMVDGKEVSVDTLIEQASNGDSGIKRFIRANIEGYESLVHKNAGESLEKADPETTAKVRAEIEWYATAKPKGGQSLKDLGAEFNERIKRIKAENRDDGKNTDEKLIDNYLDVARQARQRFEHGVAMEKVMEGFKVYNAKVRNGIRTEAHRDRIDKIVNKWENSKLGQFIPPEFIAAALGIVPALTQTGARALGGAGVGIGASAIFAGLRERNRVTEDRARMQRDIAMGMEYNGQKDSETNKKLSRAEKYEARIGGTLYDCRSANVLTTGLNEAMEKGDAKALLQAIAEAQVRVDYSDKFPGSEFRKDLIAYSARDKVGDERLALDIALIKAKKNLSPEDQKKLRTMQSEIGNSMIEEAGKKDEEFEKERRKLVLKAGLETAAISAATLFVSEEIGSIFNSKKIGVFEEAGLIKTTNAEGANETILAGLGGRGTHTDIIENVRADQVEEIQRYKEMGFEQIEKQGSFPTMENGVVEVSPADSTNQIQVIRDDWAGGGTKNNLRAYLENGQFRSGMSGNSYLANDQALNYDELVSADKIKGILTIGGAEFEIAPSIDANGALTWGEGGIFTTTTGDTIQAIGSNGEKLYQYFEIAADTGVDANGVQHIIPLATDVGSNSFSGTMQQVAENVVDNSTVYDFVRELPREVSTNGVVLPFASRTGLGEARNRQGVEAPSNPESPTTGTSGPENSPAGTPENTPTNPSNVSGNAENVNPSGTQPVAETAPAGAPVSPEGQNPANANASENTPTSESAPTSENAPASENSEATPEGSNEQAPETIDPRENVRNFFGDMAPLLGNYGMDFLTASDSDEVPQNEMTEWWQSLDDDTKNRVRDFVAIENREDSPFGRAFRIWLATANPQ